MRSAKNGIRYLRIPLERNIGGIRLWRTFTKRNTLFWGLQTHLLAPKQRFFVSRYPHFYSTGPGGLKLSSWNKFPKPIKTSILSSTGRNPGRIPSRLYGSMDAAKVRIEPRPKKGKEKEEHEDWRDMKVLCWYEVENVSPAQRSTRQREKATREQLPLRAKNMRYFCDIAEADDFGHLLWATGCAVNADLSPELVFLGDGAVWIWNLVNHYYAQAIQIVDWYIPCRRISGKSGYRCFHRAVKTNGLARTSCPISVGRPSRRCGLGLPDPILLKLRSTPSGHLFHQQYRAYAI